MLAATFITGGLDAFRNPESKAPAADKVVAPLVDAVPQLTSTAQVVKIDGAIKVVAGSLLALGKFPRIAGLVLAGSLAPTTFAGHQFWQESDPAKRTQQRLHFLKNVGMLGGLLLAAVDTEGKPSVAWRARRAPDVISHAAGDLRRDTELKLHSAGQNVSSATHTVLDKLPV